MYFLETSAKASENVERLFTEIAHDLLQVCSVILVISELGLGIMELLGVQTKSSVVSSKFLMQDHLFWVFQQAKSRDLPSYSSSAQHILDDGGGGGGRINSLTGSTSTIIQDKCCTKMT